VAIGGEPDITGEVDAIREVLSALAPLDSATRARVLQYAQQRFGSTVGAPVSTIEAATVALPAGAPTRLEDIRSLRAEKQPGNGIEMAALVAYYLTELAPPEERSASVDAAGLTKYFKQAGYPLPKTPSMTLVHAKSAGYLDAVSRGQYRLNPVGYNLAAHSLPRSDTKRGRAPSSSKQSKRGSKSRQTKPSGIKAATSTRASRRSRG